MQYYLNWSQKTVGYFARRCEQILELAIKWAPIETKAILEVSGGNLHNSLQSEEHLNLILNSHTHTVLHFTFPIIDYPNLVPRPTKPGNKVIFFANQSLNFAIGGKSL